MLINFFPSVSDKYNFKFVMKISYKKIEMWLPFNDKFMFITTIIAIYKKIKSKHSSGDDCSTKLTLYN